MSVVDALNRIDQGDYTALQVGCSPEVRKQLEKLAVEVYKRDCARWTLAASLWLLSQGKDIPDVFMK